MQKKPPKNLLSFEEQYHLLVCEGFQVMKILQSHYIQLMNKAYQNCKTKAQLKL